MADSPRIEELRRRVQSDPASIAFAALAEEYRRSGRFEEAVQTCITGLRRHPSYLSAHVTLGRSLIEVGRYEEAREELEHVLKLAPENLAAIRGLAEIQHHHGDEVQEEYQETAPDFRPTPEAAVKLTTDFRLKPEATAQSAADIPTKPEAPEARVVLTPDAREVSIGLKPDNAARPAADFWLNPEAAEVIVELMPEVTTVSVSPALAGLEEFLGAILRARPR